MTGSVFLGWRFLVVLGVVALFAGQTAFAAVPVPRVKPAPPAPVYLSPADYQRLDQFFEAVDRDRWSEARQWRDQLTDPIARSIADWAYFRNDPDGNNLRAVADFLAAHPDWPNPLTIQAHAERSIEDDTPVSDILYFFDRLEPETGTGKGHLAHALFEKGKTAEAKKYLRDAWINHDWKASDEKRITREYGRHLTREDHAAKADRQLFQIKATATRSLLPYLSASERRKAEARIALLRRDANARALLSQLSREEQQDAGVLHAATRYFRRGDMEGEAIKWALQAPLNAEELRNPERWWTEKRLLMRWALKNGRFDDAYAMAAFTGLTTGSSFAEAEFNAGWIALRFLKDPARARPHFAYLDAGVSAPISKARAHYWLGRTFEASNDMARADLHYQVAAAYPFTYYGQLAFERTDNGVPVTFPPDQSPSAEDHALFTARPKVHALRILGELDRDYEFIAFARALDDVLQTPGEYLAYRDFMERQGKLFLAVRAGKVAVRRGAESPHVSYPLVQLPEEAASFVEPGLILGLSRQESEFNPRAFSSASARGMMQLLPATAQITARKEGLPYSRSWLLDDPSYNFIVGSAHLSHLLDQFEGSYVMTLAGYNAGPRRPLRWKDEYGDPRGTNVDPVDWVELIPFTETRNYVMRVLENTQIYRARLTGQPIQGQLTADLVRGGGSRLAIGQDTPSPFLAILHDQQKDLQASLSVQSEPAAFQVAYREPDIPAYPTFHSSPVRVADGASRTSAQVEPATPCPTDEPTMTVARADDLNNAALEDYLASSGSNGDNC